MAGVFAGNLAGSTITYNGVQFGGADSAYKSYPPQYDVVGVMIYDDAQRAVIGVEYTLTVKAIFYETTEGAMSANASAVQEKLSAVGKTLTIDGIGIGLDDIQDIDWGPKPLSFAWQPFGEVAWECVWVVKFRISKCASSASAANIWVAWNYNTTWQNDFEGQCTRTISGYVQIAGRRNNGNDQVAAVADEVRQQISVTIPEKFKRTNNVWRESDDKTRLDFVIVDEQLEGDPYPEGITLANGYCDANTIGPGFAKMDVGIGMTFKTAPGVAKGLAGVLFMQAVLAKQAAMAQRIGPKGSVIPKSLSIRNEKFDGARVTTCSATWMLTKCLNAMLNAAGIWEPLVNTNYQQWRASMENLWGNRGNAGLRSLANDDLIIDICDGVSQKAFGNTPSEPPNADANGQFQFTCPQVPADGGWIHYDVRVHLLRHDHQTYHRKAVSYSQSQIQSSPGDESAGGSTSFGEPSYSQSDSQSHITEFNGFPELQIVQIFKLLRFKHQPTPPVIKSVGGRPVVQIGSSNEFSRPAFDVFECPVWYRAGYRVYRVQGPVTVAFPVGRKDSCAAPDVREEY